MNSFGIYKSLVSQKVGSIEGKSFLRKEINLAVFFPWKVSLADEQRGSCIRAVPVRLGTRILPLMMHCLSEIEMKRSMIFLSIGTSCILNIGKQGLYQSKKC
jgi:hypothetical protein